MFIEYVDKEVKLVFKDGDRTIATTALIIRADEGFIKFLNHYNDRETTIPFDAVLKVEAAV